jgi:hypothetical protein
MTRSGLSGLSVIGTAPARASETTSVIRSTMGRHRRRLAQAKGGVVRRTPLQPGLYGLTVHVHDLHCRRVLASGIVTMLGREDGRYHVRDAEPHEAARVLCSEETWPD